MSDQVRCSFVLRVPQDDRFRYERISLRGPMGDTYLHTEHPPLVGDRIHLYSDTDETRGTFEVIERYWLHASWGATNWPYGADRPVTGPLMDVIVEASEGPYRREVIEEEPDE